VAPRRAFVPPHGSWGAVELAFRYDDFNADDATTAAFVDLTKSATHATSRTVGVNWYLTSKVRAIVNYQHTTFAHGAAGGSDRPAERIISTRVQTVF
jgi:phosphate-selective porin OprO/OprP